MILSQPKDSREAQALLKTAFVQNHPFAIRYPRGSVKFQLDHDIQAIPIGSWTIHEATSEDRIVLITYGSDVDKMIAKAEVNQLPVSVVNARFFKPLDEQMMQYIAQKQCPIIIYESDILIGGLSSAILEYYNDHHLDVDVKRIGIQDHFVQHGSLPQLRKSEHIDINSVFQLITELLCD